jgi:hypothetical protein
MAVMHRRGAVLFAAGTTAFLTDGSSLLVAVEAFHSFLHSLGAGKGLSYLSEGDDYQS